MNLPRELITIFRVQQGLRFLKSRNILSENEYCDLCDILYDKYHEYNMGNICMVNKEDVLTMCHDPYGDVDSTVEAENLVKTLFESCHLDDTCLMDFTI